jgi:hypothetical protein
MRGLLIVAIAAPLIGTGAAIRAKPIAPGTFVEWTSADGARSFVHDGVTVTLRSRWTEGSPTLTVSGRGKASLRVTVNDSTADFPSNIAIGVLARGQSPSVLLQSYTGGAHCCWHLIALVPAGKKFVKVDFGRWDGDMLAWPADLSGDGVADFRFRDQKFLYAFGSYAGSRPPFKIMTIRALKPVDVSTDPVFRPLYAADLPKMRKACLGEDNGPDGGACAGYLATAARLGRFDQAFASFRRTDLSKQTSRIDPCSDSGANACVSELAGDIRAFLRRLRYIK